jgi:hypothetical protein
LNEQNFFPIRNHGDDSVEHEFDRLLRFYLPSRMARARFAAGRSQQRWSHACVRGHLLVSIVNAR